MLQRNTQVSASRSQQAQTKHERATRSRNKYCSDSSAVAYYFGLLGFLAQNELKTGSFALLAYFGPPRTAKDAAAFRDNQPPQKRHSDPSSQGLLISNLQEQDDRGKCNECNNNDKESTTSDRLRSKLNKNLHNKRSTSQQSKSLASLLSLISLPLVCFIHNAPPCSCFSHDEHNHHIGLIRYDHPLAQSPSRTYLTTTNVNDNRHPVPTNSNQRPTRGYFSSQPNTDYDGDPLMGIMSSLLGSFSQNDQANIPPPMSQTWTSIFGNPFGSSNSNNGGGGGGDLLDAHIKAILLPRVSGTPGNEQARQYIINNLRKNDYHIELDEFTGNTPVGNVKFANIIASSNPNACRQLVLACHYDSKMMDGFLGATDSAVPCAMLLKIAETFNKSYRPSSNPVSNSATDSNSRHDLGLMFIFFDGEEAFVQWSSTDSLYGSRHLAAKWSRQPAPQECKLGAGKTELDRIELFVLLDLIGASDTSFVMFSTRLKHHYEALQSYEKAHLIKSGQSQSEARRNAVFRTRTMPLNFLEDDHTPFKNRGVPILLLTAHPFPRVWHTTGDNYAAIDFPKTRRILHVMEEFVANYPNRG